MATTTVTHDRVSIELSTFEKVAGLLRDLDLPLGSVESVAVAPDSLAAVRGLRAPGLGLPGYRLIGTWRGRGGKRFVSVKRAQPALHLRLLGARFDEVVVAAPRAADLAEEIRVARADVP